LTSSIPEGAGSRQDASSEKLDDAELVRQSQAGNLGAFETLVARHSGRVYALALRILHQPEDSEDVTQQTFLNAIEGLDKFRGESQFGTWLLRIATHAALKVLRKRRGLPTMSLDATTDEQDAHGHIPHPDYIADWRQSPEQLVGNREIWALLEESLGRLDDKYASVFMLRDIEGCSIAETAATLGLSEANTKVRLLRARLQLREELTRAFGDPATQMHHPTHTHG
jgi:RNA polymerase sigma-70 factor, ECF subfamily